MERFGYASLAAVRAESAELLRHLAIEALGRVEPEGMADGQ